MSAGKRDKVRKGLSSLRSSPERISVRTERSESGWRTDRADRSNAPQAILREREGNSRQRGRERGWKSRAAFTLAEVLITLGIIGVVAAMTIPGLMSKYHRSQTEQRLKQSYSIVAQMLRLSQAEYGDVDVLAELDYDGGFSHEASKAVFDTYFRPFVTVARTYEDSKCDNMMTSYGAGSNSQAYTDTTHACYQLQNGTVLAFSAGNMWGQAAIDLTVILNPNKVRKVDGKDCFKFLVFTGEKGFELMTFGNLYNRNFSREELITRCGGDTARYSVGVLTFGRSNFCSELIMKNSWKIPDDYPVKF